MPEIKKAKNKCRSRDLSKDNRSRSSKCFADEEMRPNVSCSNFFADTNSMLFNGDCIEKLKAIPAQSVSLLLTDPPYNLGLFMKGRGTNMGKLRENHFAVSGWDQLGTEEEIKIYALAS